MSRKDLGWSRYLNSKWCLQQQLFIQLSRSSPASADKYILLPNKRTPCMSKWEKSLTVVVRCLHLGGKSYWIAKSLTWIDKLEKEVEGCKRPLWWAVLCLIMLYFELGKVTIWYGHLLIFAGILAIKSLSIHPTCACSCQTCCSFQNSPKQRNFSDVIWRGSLSVCSYTKLKRMPFKKTWPLLW